jgi:ACS family glucarate transporter-like MFS transporter
MGANPQMIAESQRPTRARHIVIVFAVALAVIQYVDRVCISKAMPTIQKDLGFSSIEVGYIFGAFTLAYALFEIPTGWLGDRIGPRKVLLRVVAWWSLFTAATGWVTSAIAMMAVRFLFGAGEAGCFPNITKAFTHWLPRSEWLRGQSLLWLSARWGGALTPLLVVWILSMVSWRAAFQIFGLLGIVWAIFFYRWYRDNPLEHPSVNAGERELLADVAQTDSRHAPVPWRTFLRSRTAWLLWLQYACLSYVWYFYITWFPTWLDQTQGSALGPAALAVIAGLPLLGGGFGSLIAGRVAAPLSRRIGGSGRARKALAITGFVAAAVTFLAAMQVRDPWTMAALVALAGLFNDFTMPCSWGTCMDVGGRFAGTFSGSMNMMGNLGGFVAPIATGYILQLTGAFDLAIYISSGMYLVGAACWLLIDPDTRLDEASVLP